MGLFSGLKRILFGSSPKAPDYGPMGEAQKYAADKQYEASQQYIAEWKRHHDQVRADYAPYRAIGLSAINRIKEGLESGEYKLEEWSGKEYVAPKFDDYFDPDDHKFEFRERPGYKFRVAEGEKAIRRRAAAGSGARGGSTYKALLKHGQDVASAEYDSAYSRYERDYGRAYNTAMTRYTADREGRLDERTAAIQDWQLRNQNKRNNLSQWVSIAGIGANAVGSGGQMQANALSQQTNLARFGASALGAGRIGAAQSRIDQQTAFNNQWQSDFNNWMSIFGLGVGARTGNRMV